MFGWFLEFRFTAVHTVLRFRLAELASVNLNFKEFFAVARGGVIGAAKCPNKSRSTHLVSFANSRHRTSNEASQNTFFLRCLAAQEKDILGNFVKNLETSLFA